MQAFAVIPAAGRSLRMGQPKLLLPWGPSTVIEHVLSVWRASAVAQTVIVIHPDDHRLAALSRDCGALVVQPEIAPDEMKGSVRLGLEFVEQTLSPQPDDAWLLAPADMPGISPATIDRLIAAYQAGSHGAAGSPRIWAPRSGGRRGHPVLFAWSLANEVGMLSDDEGIKALLHRHPVAYLDDGVEAAIEDLDTPQDYARLRPHHGAGPFPDPPR
jgi:molybdenum cofactor cytidylyltransferase